MGKYLRRYYGILLAIIFFILSLQFSLSQRALPPPARQAVWIVSSVSFPILELITNTSRKAKEFFSDYLYLTGVAKENRMLKEEIRVLKAKIESLKEIERENERLKKLVSFAGVEGPREEKIVAKIVTQDLSPWSRGFFISAGEKDGIKPGMAVVVPEGVVGKVFRVFYTTSYVISSTDHRFSLDVRTQEGRVRCIMKGTGTGIVVKYLRTTDKVSKGELLVTTGFEGHFLPGTPAAVVTEMKEEAGSIFKKVEALPLVDMRRLEEVIVLLSTKEGKEMGKR